MVGRKICFPRSLPIQCREPSTIGRKLKTFHQINLIMARVILDFCTCLPSALPFFPPPLQNHSSKLIGIFCCFLAGYYGFSSFDGQGKKGKINFHTGCERKVRLNFKKNFTLMGSQHGKCVRSNFHRGWLR